MSWVNRTIAFGAMAMHALPISKVRTFFVPFWRPPCRPRFAGVPVVVIVTYLRTSLAEVL